MIRFTTRVNIGVALVALCGFTLSADAQAQSRQRFVSEPISEFATAYSERRHEALDARHLDATRYHAFRLASSEPSSVVIARSVRVDENGKLHIVGEPGTSMKGGGSGGPGYLHILLPIGVQPPR